MTPELRTWKFLRGAVVFMFCSCSQGIKDDKAVLGWINMETQQKPHDLFSRKYLMWITAYVKGNYPFMFIQKQSIERIQVHSCIKMQRAEKGKTGNSIRQSLIQVVNEHLQNIKFQKWCAYYYQNSLNYLCRSCEHYCQKSFLVKKGASQNKQKIMVIEANNLLATEESLCMVLLSGEKKAFTK